MWRSAFRTSNPNWLLCPESMHSHLARCCLQRYQARLQGAAHCPLDHLDYANAGEMKRLYVRPNFRGVGLGRMLAEGILEHARLFGFKYVLLDTLDDMEAARALYGELGFEEIPPYYFNPIAGAHYLRVAL